MKLLADLFIVIGLLLVLNLSADEDTPFPVGTIMKIDGKAKILPAMSIKKHRAKVGEGLLKGDRLLTYRDTKVLVKLLDDSKVVLNENVELLFANEDDLEQKSGEVYYKIRSRGKSSGLKVKTPFSIIGIKGTEFLVNFENEGEIALNEGVIGVASYDEAFELYQQKVEQDFERYQREQEAGFEAYQRRFDEQEARYVKSFELQANKMLRFNAASQCSKNCEKQVVEEGLSDDIKARFKAYQEMIQE